MSDLSNLFVTLNEFQDAALLLLRLLVGSLFVYSGFGKYKKLASFANENGLPVPVAFIGVSAEFWGGLGVAFGVLTPPAASGILLVMCGSIYHHVVKWKSPYWAAKGGWEYDLMWLTMCLVIITTGGGNIALYRGY